MKKQSFKLTKILHLSNFHLGFSLMEMMIVLLIVALVAAASAPMVTKKMTRGAGSGDSPWIFTGLNNDIAFLGDRVIIGAASYDPNGSGVEHPRLVLAGGDGLAFANENGRFTNRIELGENTVAINDSELGPNSVGIGMGQNLNSKSNIVAIGQGVQITQDDSVAMGYNAYSGGQNGVAIGQSAWVGDGANNSIAIGNSATGTNAQEAIAIGEGATASRNGAIAIGNNASVTGGNNSVAIGTGAVASHVVTNGAYDGPQIVLGTEQSTVHIPGNLIVGGDVLLAARPRHIVVMREARGAPGAVADGNECLYAFTNVDDQHDPKVSMFGSGYVNGITYDTFVTNRTMFHQTGRLEFSDRRLKNVGEAYTAGLEELKKLEFFHYTFKKDEAKVPHVGVMAQDLQKVFPDAVTKGEDGYLRIRTEDMFFAVINAVKELDKKIADAVLGIKANTESISELKQIIEAQQSTIETQQKVIEELQKQNKDTEKRLIKLEKSKNK